MGARAWGRGYYMSTIHIRPRPYWRQRRAQKGLKAKSVHPYQNRSKTCIGAPLPFFCRPHTRLSPKYDLPAIVRENIRDRQLDL